MKKTIFNLNMLAITVGANKLAAETVVSQPLIKIPTDEGVRYEFDQQKFKEYISSSSYRSFSPYKRKKTTSLKKVYQSSDLRTQGDNLYPSAIEDSSPASQETGSGACRNSSKVKELLAEIAPVLMKKARKSCRQCLSRQFGKALEQVDGFRYQADLEFRKYQVAKPSPQQASGSSSQPLTNKWVYVK